MSLLAPGGPLEAFCLRRGAGRSKRALFTLLCCLAGGKLSPRSTARRPHSRAPLGSSLCKGRGEPGAGTRYCFGTLRTSRAGDIPRFTTRPAFAPTFGTTPGKSFPISLKRRAWTALDAGCCSSAAADRDELSTLVHSCLFRLPANKWKNEPSSRRGATRGANTLRATRRTPCEAAAPRWAIDWLRWLLSEKKTLPGQD